MEKRIQILIALAPALLVGCLVLAVTFRAAAKWVQNLDVGFGKAYGTVFLPCAVMAMLGLMVDNIVQSKAWSPSAVNGTAVALNLAGYFLQSGYIGSQIKIAFKRACLVGLVMYAINAGILLMVFGIYLSAGLDKKYL